MARIGIIGLGDVGAPIARALARKGHALTVSERSRAAADNISARYDNVSAASNQAVIDAAEIVFLCLRPEVAADIVAPLVFRPGQRVVSVMAGIGLAALSELCAPATDISMTIPMAFVETGGCPLPVCPHDRTLAPLLGDDNPVIAVADETAFARHFAASTVLSAALTTMIETAGWLGGRNGDAAAAETYVAALVAGFLGAIPQDGAGRIRAARDGLATPGTLNLAMLEALEANGTPDAIRAALDALERRLI